MHYLKERTVSTDWTDSNKDAIANALKQVKILDPACGSGAFPMGCLLRIVDIIELLKGDTSTATNSNSLSLRIVSMALISSNRHAYM